MAIDWATEIRDATRQAIDVNEAKRVSANDSNFMASVATPELRLAA